MDVHLFSSAGDRMRLAADLALVQASIDAAESALLRCREVPGWRSSAAALYGELATELAGALADARDRMLGAKLVIDRAALE